MSSRNKLQDATGVVLSIDENNYAHVVKSTAPSGGETNYITGALWQNKGGGVGSALYVNVGTTTSASWVNVA